MAAVSWAGGDGAGDPATALKERVYHFPTHEDAGEFLAALQRVQAAMAARG